MRRLVGVVVAAFVLAGCVAPLWAQGTTYKKNEQQVRIYVLAEIRGYVVQSNKYTAVVEVNKRVEELKAEAEQTKAENAKLLKEINDLKKKLPSLKASISRETDVNKQADLKTQLADIEKQIKDKTDTLKPVVQWQMSRAFSKLEDADKWIGDLEQQAKDAEAQAEKQKAK